MESDIESHINAPVQKPGPVAYNHFKHLISVGTRGST
jgi:hypothetical protein